MSFIKIAAVVAVAGVLASISVPAMAFENEFHGSSSLRYYLSNYEAGAGGNLLTSVNAAGLVPLQAWNTTNKLKMNNYFDQRTRLSYTAKASDDLKLVVGFEIDSVFGDRAQGQTSYGSATAATASGATGRNQGGAWESDTVNLETKHVYLQFKIPSTSTTVTAGIQPFKDSLKGIFVDVDAAGILTSTKVGQATINAGYFRGYDQSYFATATTARPRGMDNLDFGLLEGKFALSKDLNLGVVYYLYNDGRATLGTAAAANNVVGTNNTATMILHIFGLTADAKMGPLALSGFFAYQGGVFKNQFANNGSAYLNAFAYNLAAKMAAGPGNLRTALLFTSGNSADASKTGHYTGWIGTAQSQNNTWSASGSGSSTYNDSGMMLLNRNSAANSCTTEHALAYNTGNGTSPLTMQGLYLYTLGYDANFTPKFYTNFNFGALWAAKTNALKPVDYEATYRTGRKVQNGTNYMGSELNFESGYKMYDNLTASFGAAYVMLGGYYKNASAASYLPTATVAGKAYSPENPYTVRTTLKFAF